MALFIGFSKWSNSSRKSTILEAIVYIIRVIIKKMDKCVWEKIGAIVYCLWSKYR